MPKDIAGDSRATVLGEIALGANAILLTIDGSGGAGAPVVDLQLKQSSLLLRHLNRMSGSLRYARQADLVVYEYNSGIVDYPRFGLHLFELRCKELFGRHLRAVVFHGSDLRPLDASWGAQYEALGVDTRKTKKRVAIARARADLLYVKTPDLLHLMPEAKWLPQAVAVDVAEGEAARSREAALRIAHAPTNRGLKGTESVVAACASLRARGVDVQLDLIEGVSAGDALKRIAAADLVIDQLLVGWYGVVSIEAMALGKPVLCYVNESLVEKVGERPPILNVEEGTLESILESIAVGGLEVNKLGHAGPDYYERVHSCVGVARRLLTDAIQLLRGAK